jgi:hypothetical protein
MRRRIKMDLKDRNNPLGQNKVSKKIGPGLNASLDKNNSEEFIEQVKENAKHPPTSKKKNVVPDPLNESGFDKREPGPQSH